MKRVTLVSINPPYTELIFAGEKDVEWRRNPLPFGRALVYETKKHGGCGMIIGAVEISGRHVFQRGETVSSRFIRRGCVSAAVLKKYSGEGESAKLVAHFLGNAALFDGPRPLSDYGLSRPPQSWCYVMEG